MLRNILESNPIGIMSERKQSEDYMKDHMPEFASNVDYFRNGLKVCLDKNAINDLFDFLKQKINFFSEIEYIL